MFTVNRSDSIIVREYGSAGPFVVVLHGGPGAPGHMAPVARELADGFRVLEPLQRPSGPHALTVATHIADLHEVVASLDGAKALLVGSSWGAMLALAYAAAHPMVVQGVVAIGCGTFDVESRQRFRQLVDGRTDAGLRASLASLDASTPDADARLEAKATLLLSVYSHDLVTSDLELTGADARSNRETWDDMLRLQAAGVYPQSFRSIDAPVLMLHGSVDPHPGALIHRSLALHIRRLEYHEWSDCGHYPWLERSVRVAFYRKLKSWLLEVSSAAAATR